MHLHMRTGFWQGPNASVAQVLEPFFARGKQQPTAASGRLSSRQSPGYGHSDSRVSQQGWQEEHDASHGICRAASMQRTL